MRTYDDWKLDSGYEDGDAPEPTKIITRYEPPPIPVRGYDWRAYLQEWDIDDPIGFGATEAEAIADLQEQLTEQENSNG